MDTPYIPDLPSIPFCKATRDLVAEKLRHPDTLLEGTEILSDWLQRGLLHEGNSDEFYKLLLNTSESATLLLEEKDDIEERVKDAERKLNESVASVHEQLDLLQQVFDHPNFSVILNNFPDDERQNILLWKDEFLQATRESAANLTRKMKSKKKKRASKKKSVANAAADLAKAEEVSKLKVEKEELEFQLGVAHLRLVNERYDQQQEVDNLKQSVIDAQKKCEEYEAQLADWRAVHDKLRYPRYSEAAKHQQDDSLNNKEARLITELSKYLGDLPGATLTDIRTHLHRKGFTLSGKYIAALMRRFPALFREETKGSGKTMKVKWVFIDSDH